MPTVSPLHSEDGRRLLDVIDKLKLLPSISHDIALPQIVVVGQQSSGKSSVLKALSKINFPTNSGLCTHFATEIACRRSTQTSSRALIIPSESTNVEYGARIEAFSERWAAIPSDQDISKIIEDAKTTMGVDNVKRISRDKLRLEFSGPTQDHISLIDLPGLFEQVVPPQRDLDKELVGSMVDEYIEKEHTIVLAVVSGSSDLGAQTITGRFEKYQERVLGIITKPDMVDPGTPHDVDLAQLVANELFTAGYGWYVVRGLSHAEEQAGFTRDTLEAHFFKKMPRAVPPFWTHIPATHLGIDNLKHRLATLLQGSIAEGLPHIQRQLRSALTSSEQALDVLGPERGSIPQQRDYLANKSEALREYTKVELNGGHGIPSLRARIRLANEDFAQRMNEKGATWNFLGGSAVPDGYKKPSDPDSPQLMADHEWVVTMREEISNSRGRELDGLINTMWVGRMFIRQSRKWQRFAENHLDEAFAIVQDYFQNTLAKVVGPDSAERFLCHAIEPELERRRLALRAKAKELLSPYATEHISTLNRNFRIHQKDSSPLLTKEAGKTALTHNTIVHYTLIMIEFYGLALNVFVDNIESLAVGNVLLGGLEDILTPLMAHRMPEADVEALAGESETIKRQRSTLVARIRDYREGNRLISNYTMRSLASAHGWQRGEVGLEEAFGSVNLTDTAELHTAPASPIVEFHTGYAP